MTILMIDRWQVIEKSNKNDSNGLIQVTSSTDFRYNTIIELRHISGKSNKNVSLQWRKENIISRHICGRQIF